MIAYRLYQNQNMYNLRVINTLRYLHTTILRFEPPANKPPARPRSNNFRRSDIVKCTVAIRNHMRNGECDAALLLFNSMPCKDEVIYGTMISGYISNGEFKLAQQVFDEMPVKNLATQNIMIKGHFKNNNLEAARKLFDDMPVKNVVSWTTILSGYLQNGLMDEAKRVFDKMPNRNSITWLTIIVGYSQNGESEESLQFFIEATRDWERLNNHTFASVLSTCANIAAFELDKQIHGLVVKGGFEFNCSVGSALVLMYCRCGSIEEAYEVFKRIEDKNVIAWSTIINGYARHGFGQEALQHFESMKQASIQPNETTMVGVLTACSHTGLVDRGKHYFYSMRQDHGIVPNIYNYGCLIDLLGRAGRLNEAHNLMKSMPFEPDATIWGSLLGASRIHGNIELGEKAAEMLFDLEPWSSAVYVQLSNLYAALGRWEDVKKTRLKMSGRSVSKTTGNSWIVVLNKIHKFFAGSSIDQL